MKKMKNKLLVDFFREIKKSPGRFISIFFIVLIGSAFFSGLRSTGLDMRISADTYYDDTSLMDAMIIGSMGLTDKELDLIQKVDGLSHIEAVYTKDVLLDRPDKEILVKLIQHTEKVNSPYLLEGRLPKKKDECLIDRRLVKEGYKPGDKLSLKSGNKKKLKEDVSVSEVTVTGVCHLPYYLETDRGTGKIGDGSVDAFLILPKEAFLSEVYTEVYLTFTGTKELLTYSSAYKEKTAPTLSSLEALEEALSNSRYESIYAKASDKIKKNEKKISDAEKTLSDAKQKLKEEEEKLAPYAAFFPKEMETLLKEKEAFEKKEKEERAKIAAAKKKLLKARKDIKKLSPPDTYILGRDKMASFVSFEQNADRMDGISNVFPVIFFLVAALVCLTAMKRMVDENRIGMGTLKALGFPNRKIIEKYILYSLSATFTGSLLGILIGERYFPLLIISSYQTLFIGMPYIFTPLNYKEGFLALFVATLSTGGATLLSSYKCLRESPAALMRPVPPKHGKRIFLERLPFIWRRLNFNRKSTIRNLARYKKRLIMTVIGIGGCTGLLLVAFGLKDSISEIANKQYVDIFTYDARVTLNTQASAEEKAELLTRIEKKSEIGSQKYLYYQTVDLGKDESFKQAFLFIPENTEKIEEYVILRDYKTKEALSFPDEGIYISEKIAKILKIREGEEILLGKVGKERVKIKVEKIVENYIFHFVFMSPSTYKSLYKKEPPYNSLFLSYAESLQDEEKLGASLIPFDAATGVYFVTELKNNFTSMLRVLDLVIFVLINSAGLLAFVVLYNLNSINVMERKRELATLKVLGFYDGEVSSYIYRENMILTVLGSLAGIVFGIVLHKFVVETVEIDLMMFGRRISPLSYALSFLITFFFSFLVNFVMHFILKRIDMIESLKSVE